MSSVVSGNSEPLTPHDRRAPSEDSHPDRPAAYVDPATLDAEHKKWTPKKIAIWIAIALLGGFSWVMVALVRGETVNGIWFVFAAVCSYLIGYRFYSRFIEAKLAQPDDRRATPAEYDADGKDYAPTDRRVLFGHHFAAIAGAGPLVGPVLAAQMGYLPGTIWIIVGVIFAGAVQDYLVLFFSMRRGGRSLGQMAKEELGTVGGYAAILATLAIMIIITAILALVVVNALGESPWGVFSVGMTIPIALFMGIYLRYLRPGKVGEVSIIGFVLLMAAIIAGGWVAETDWGVQYLTLDRVTLAWAVIIYGFIAAVEAGAMGYLLKDAPPEQVRTAVQNTVAGKRTLSPEITTALLDRMRTPAVDLSPREKELLTALATGATNRQLAKQLFISEATVKTHLVHIYAKLGVENRTGAISKARQMGLV